jgi:hypothetical protein
VDFDALRASCRHCGWQLGGSGGAYRAVLGRGPSDPEPGSSPAPELQRRLPPLPHFVTVVEGGSERMPTLEVTINPRARWRLLLVALPLAAQLWLLWDIGRGFAVSALIWFAVLYLLAANIANVVQIRVTTGMLLVTHSPFPWPSKRIPVSQLEQLWVDEQLTRNGSTMFRLLARAQNKDVVLVDRFDDPSGALHLEQRIEKMLGIADVPIRGEIDVQR